MTRIKFFFRKKKKKKILIRELYIPKSFKNSTLILLSSGYEFVMSSKTSHVSSSPNLMRKYHLKPNYDISLDISNWEIPTSEFRSRNLIVVELLPLKLFIQICPQSPIWREGRGVEEKKGSSMRERILVNNDLLFGLKCINSCGYDDMLTNFFSYFLSPSYYYRFPDFSDQCRDLN